MKLVIDLDGIEMTDHPDPTDFLRAADPRRPALDRAGLACTYIARLMISMDREIQQDPIDIESLDALIDAVLTNTRTLESALREIEFNPR